MKVLITGGAGFIGSHLVERLVKEEHTLLVIDDLSNGQLKNLEAVKDRISFLKHDVSNPIHLDFRPQTIFHLSCFPRSRSFIQPQRDIEVNVIGMVNVLEVAKRNNAKVIFSSNSGIYDTSTIPIDENTLDSPTTPYDLDKLQSEQYLKLYNQTYGIPYIIFRFATVFGTRQNISPEWKPVIVEFITKLRNEQKPTIFWDGEQTRDFIFADDVVDALILAMETEQANGETMILGTGKETSINEVYNIICELLRVNIEPNHGPKQLGDIKRMRYDCNKAERILGWKAKTSLKEGIKKVLEWMDE